jgi:hypothetical protein
MSYIIFITNILLSMVVIYYYMRLLISLFIGFNSTNKVIIQNNIFINFFSQNLILANTKYDELSISKTCQIGLIFLITLSTFIVSPLLNIVLLI